MHVRRIKLPAQGHATLACLEMLPAKVGCLLGRGAPPTDIKVAPTSRVLPPARWVSYRIVHIAKDE